MASSNQGGSILSFIVIGGVLAVLLIGGAYFVQQRATHPTQAPTPVATQPANPSSDKKVATEPKKDNPTPAAPKQDTPTATTPTAPPSAELPKTGATEAIGSILGAGLLSGTIVAYIRSRRPSVTL